MKEPDWVVQNDLRLPLREVLTIVMLVITSLMYRHWISSMLVNVAQLQIVQTLIRQPSANLNQPVSVNLETTILKYLVLAEQLSDLKGRAASLQGRFHLFQGEYGLAVRDLKRSQDQGATDLLTEVALAHACYYLNDLNCAFPLFWANVQWLEGQEFASRYEPVLATFTRAASRSGDDRLGTEELCSLLISMIRMDGTNLFARARLYEDDLRSRCGNEYVALASSRIDEFAFKPWRLRELKDAELEAAIRLVKEGAWPQATAQRVLQYLAWHDPERLQSFLNDPKWFPNNCQEYAVLRAELALRMREPAVALSYLEPFMRDALSPQVVLEIGRAYTMLGNVEAASYWYEEYLRLRPEALEVYGLLAQTQLLAPSSKTAFFSELKAEWQRRTDDTLAVASMLGLEPDRVRFSANLLANGDFEDSHEATDKGTISWLSISRDPAWRNEPNPNYQLATNPDKWFWVSDADGQVFSRGLFIGGLDDFDSPDGTQSVRIDGLWADNEPGLILGNGGYRYRLFDAGVELLPGHPYLFSFFYKTEGVRDDSFAAVWMSGNRRVFFDHEYRLPPTDGTWRRFVIIGRNNLQHSVEVHPTLMLYGVGSVWFDSVNLRAIELPAGATVPLETVFRQF